MRRKKKEKIRWNIGMIIFLVLLIYVIINVITFLGKKKLSVYKVTEDRINNTFSFTGIALRDEKLLKAKESGYITYYVEEGKRIKKSGTLFVLDKNGKVQEALVKQAQKKKSEKRAADDAGIQQKIKDYQADYSDTKFSKVYDLKYDLKNVVLSLNENAKKNVIDQMRKKLGQDSFYIEKSPQSGVITFYSDNFDEKGKKDITSADFDQEQYHMVKYNSSDKVKKNAVVCRIAKGEKWTIVIPLKKEQYDLLRGNEKVYIKFMSDQQKTQASLNVEKKGDDYLGYLSLNDYMIRYIDERYLDLDVSLTSYRGLKIPNSAITKKKFYRVPVEYLCKQENGENEFQVRKIDSDGNVTIEKKNYKICKQTKEYCYLDPEEVGQKVVLQSMKSGATYLMEKTESLEGVFYTNHGYTQFRLIEPIAKKDDYTIIRDDTKDGINLYDFIVLDSSTIKENQVIY